MPLVLRSLSHKWALKKWLDGTGKNQIKEGREFLSPPLLYFYEKFI